MKAPIFRLASNFAFHIASGHGILAKAKGIELLVTLLPLHPHIFAILVCVAFNQPILRWFLRITPHFGSIIVALMHAEPVIATNSPGVLPLHSLGLWVVLRFKTNAFQFFVEFQSAMI